MAREYKDEFTLDGRIKPVNHYVTRTKVAEADKLFTRALQGDRIAVGQIEEVHASSDLKFNAAHLITVSMIPQFDDAVRTWSSVAGVRTVPDFGPVRLMSMFGDLTGAGVRSGGAEGISGGLPVVPEGTPYPYVTVTGQEASWAKLNKGGAKFGFTWESGVNDVIGFYDDMPSELLQLALDTEEREVYEALIEGTTQELAAQTLPDGTVTVPNAPISPNAIWASIIQLQNVVVNGRKVGRAPGYNVIVPAGTAEFVEWALRQTIISVQDGLLTLGPGDRSVLSTVTIVESVYLEGTNWIVLPKPNAFRRPVVELLRLRGYETPELRVHGDTGQYVGGSAVSPFEGNFDTDTIDYRIRYVTGGVLWSDAYSVKSDGSGTP